MVRITASGDIIHDDDREAPPRQRVPQNQGQVHQGNQGNEEPVYHMPDGTSIFDTLNQKLLDAGVPRFNIGSWTVEPIVLLGFLLAFLFMGFNGIIFAGLLFAIVKFSQSGVPTGGHVNPGPRGPQGQGPQGPHGPQGPDGPGRPAGNRPTRRARWGAGRWGSAGSGNRLGR